MQELKIDPEFQSKIPPLTDAEFEQLRENILSAGEVYEPIIVWNGVIVDGHNRWKIVRERPEIQFKIRDMNFPDKWAAFDWMYKNQLGRRNLTDAQRTYLLGKMYEARKNSIGNHATRGNDGKFHKPEKQVLGKPKSTAHKIAAEFGTSHDTVEKAGQYAKGIDILKEVSPKLADSVLKGEVKASKTVIRDIGKSTPEQREAAAKAIEKGESVTPQKQYTETRTAHYNGGGTREYREQREQIAAITADMFDSSTLPEFTVDDLIDEIKVNAELYVRQLKNTVADNSTLLTDEARPAVASAIEEYVIEKAKEIRRLVYEERT